MIALTADQYRRRWSEAELQQAVINEAHREGWRVAHFRPAQNSRGDWRTPVAADGKGFPDLVLVHGVRGLVVFAELKREGEKLRPEQRVWLDNLLAADAAAFVWRPSDWSQIVAVLNGSFVDDVE